MKVDKALLTAGVLSVALSGPAWSFPRTGDALPSTMVEDADGRRLALADLAGKPILVFYEDKSSAEQNKPLKDALGRLAQGDRYLRTVALVPVADVSAYDFWPARGFVKDAIRDESRKAGTTIYCDWSGSFRQALGLTAKASNVILAGRDGKIRFARSGALSADEQARVIELLRAEVGSQPQR